MADSLKQPYLRKGGQGLVLQPGVSRSSWSWRWIAAPSFSLDNSGSAGVDKPHISALRTLPKWRNLVDALGSGSSGSTPVRVQVPASAP